MKKGLFLLTSFLISGTAFSSMLNQNNKQDVTLKTVKSLDIIDLTMPWWGTSKVNTPNLTQLLNNNTHTNPQNSKMILTTPDKISIEATSSFDHSTLRALLNYEKIHFTNIELSVSKEHSYANYLTAYYNYWSTSEGKQKDGVKVINRFDWSTVDKIDRFWTKDIQFEFNLTF